MASKQSQERWVGEYLHIAGHAIADKHFTQLLFALDTSQTSILHAQMYFHFASHENISTSFLATIVIRLKTAQQLHQQICYIECCPKRKINV
jgi:hypothetical protein